VDDYGRLPHVDEHHVIVAERSGYVAGLDAELVGRGSVALGAGRDRVEDPVDPAVGIVVLAQPGDRVRAGDPGRAVHTRGAARLAGAVPLAGRAITIGDTPPSLRASIVGEVR